MIVFMISWLSTTKTEMVCFEIGLTIFTEMIQRASPFAENTETKIFIFYEESSKFEFSLDESGFRSFILIEL